MIILDQYGHYPRLATCKIQLAEERPKLIQLGKAKIDLFPELVGFLGKPMDDSQGDSSEQQAQLKKFRVTTTDDLDILFGIVLWPQAKPEVRFLEWVDGESKYKCLQGTGRMSIDSPVPETWMGQLRAMKYNHKSKKTNLANITLSKLDEFSQQDFAERLLSSGATAVGTREVLHGETNKNKNNLAFLAKPMDFETVAIAFTATRVLAVMHDYGLDN